MSDMEIWWSAYLAVLAGGGTNALAVKKADIALGDYLAMLEDGSNG